MSAHSPENQSYHGLHQDWPAGWGRWFCPSTLLSWDPTCSTTCSSGIPSTSKTWTCWSGSRGGPWKQSEGWNTSPVKKGWESWGCSASRREGLIVAFRHVKGAYKNDGERLFTRVCSDRTGGNGFEMKRLDLDWTKGRSSLLWGRWDNRTGCPE